MGKKRQQGNPHQAQSFGQMVSIAALNQLRPHIQTMVNDLGQRLAHQQARSYEMLFSRVVVLEKLLMEKFGITDVDLADRFSNVEDEREGMKLTDQVQAGDLVRLEVKTKTKDQDEFQGSTRLKCYNTGTGNTLGTELENAMLGMKTGETKVLEIGDKKSPIVAQLTINRVSRPIPPPQQPEPVVPQVSDEEAIPATLVEETSSGTTTAG